MTRNLEKLYDNPVWAVMAAILTQLSQEIAKTNGQTPVLIFTGGNAGESADTGTHLTVTFTCSSSMGVLSWLSHGLEKVVPQPTWSTRASDGADSEPSAVTVEQVGGVCVQGWCNKKNTHMGDDDLWYIICAHFTFFSILFSQQRPQPEKVEGGCSVATEGWWRVKRGKNLVWMETEIA